MGERRCISCGGYMEVIKNGFHFLVNGDLHTSDLWGCRRCKRFQIHGIPKEGPMLGNISICSGGEVQRDPGNGKFVAILDPVLLFHSSVPKYLKEWYPHWDGVLDKKGEDDAS